MTQDQIDLLRDIRKRKGRSVRPKGSRLEDDPLYKFLTEQEIKICFNCNHLRPDGSCAGYPIGGPWNCTICRICGKVLKR
jgi:hypothetical protein